MQVMFTIRQPVHCNVQLHVPHVAISLIFLKIQKKMSLCKYYDFLKAISVRFLLLCLVLQLCND